MWALCLGLALTLFVTQARAQGSFVLNCQPAPASCEWTAGASWIVTGSNNTYPGLACTDVVVANSTGAALTAALSGDLCLSSLFIGPNVASVSWTSTASAGSVVTVLVENQVTSFVPSLAISTGVVCDWQTMTIGTAAELGANLGSASEVVTFSGSGTVLLGELISTATIVLNGLTVNVTERGFVQLLDASSLALVGASMTLSRSTTVGTGSHTDFVYPSNMTVDAASALSIEPHVAVYYLPLFIESGAALTVTGSGVEPHDDSSTETSLAASSSTSSSAQKTVVDGFIVTWITFVRGPGALMTVRMPAGGQIESEFFWVEAGVALALPDSGVVACAELIMEMGSSLNMTADKFVFALTKIGLLQGSISVQSGRLGLHCLNTVSQCGVSIAANVSIVEPSARLAVTGTGIVGLFGFSYSGQGTLQVAQCQVLAGFDGASLNTIEVTTLDLPVLQLRSSLLVGLNSSLVLGAQTEIIGAFVVDEQMPTLAILPGSTLVMLPFSVLTVTLVSVTAPENSLIVPIGAKLLVRGGSLSGFIDVTAPGAEFAAVGFDDSFLSVADSLMISGDMAFSTTIELSFASLQLSGSLIAFTDTATLAFTDSLSTVQASSLYLDPSTSLSITFAGLGFSDGIVPITLNRTLVAAGTLLFCAEMYPFSASVVVMQYAHLAGSFASVSVCAETHGTLVVGPTQMTFQAAGKPDAPTPSRAPMAALIVPIVFGSLAVLATCVLGVVVYIRRKRRANSYRALNA